MRNRLIPFAWRNLLNGLKGKSYQIAEAEYYYEGEELERKLVEIEYDSDEKERNAKLLDIDLKYGKIDKHKYEKQKADLLDEAWVHCTLHTNEKNVFDGYFELDWNEAFIEKLREKGYDGVAEEAVVEQWLQTIHINELIDAGVIGGDEMTTPTNVINKRDLGEDKTSYS